MAKDRASEPAWENVPRLFISSTVEDLREYRTAVRDAAVGAEMLPRMLEYFPAAGDRLPLDKCLAEVSAADLLAVIVAHRYGWVPPDQPGDEYKSITWLECERAVADGREVLAFLVDDRQPWPDDQREEQAILAAVRQGTATPELLSMVQRNVARLRDFKAWLNSRAIRTTFTTPDDLRTRVTEALHDWRRRHLLGRSVASAPQVVVADPGPYLRELRDATAQIDIRGLQVGAGKANRFAIEDLYISLSAAGGWEAGGRTPGERGEPRGRLADKPDEMPAQAAKLSRDMPLHQALSRSPLAVVGDPGMGKTTFLRRVAFALTQARLGEDPHAAELRLGITDRTFPILLRLADLAAFLDQTPVGSGNPATPDAAAWLPRFLAARSRDQGWGLDEAYFRRLLEHGECTVLLDGLDEAPDEASRQRLARLLENAARTYVDCRLVVTSRPAAYSDQFVLADFAHVRIEPLSDEAVETFLRRWCGALYTDNATAAESHRAELLAALRARAEIRRLARNPVMLTALAVVHWNERRLPEQRADLYESILIWLARSRPPRAGRATADRTLAVLAELALAMQNHPRGRAVQVPKRWAAEALAFEFDGGTVTRHTIERAERFLDAEELDSSIIVGRGHEVRFWHLTFQEYLAARAVASRLDDEQHRLLLGDDKRLYDPLWREVALLLGGVLHQQGRAKVDGLFRAVLDDVGKKPELAAAARAAGLLGSMLRDLEPFQYQPSDARYHVLLDTVTQIFDQRRAAGVPIKTRIQAADALGQAGDTRLDTRRDDYWITIPAGKFRMGSENDDAEAHENEKPAHEVQLDAFAIARYPVTVGQYQQFVEQDGYADERWWAAGGFGRFPQPEDWEQQQPYPSRPVTGVSWFEASAFCAWAGYRLPSEAEWELAARGKKGRKFPWGNEPPDAARLNFANNVGHVTPVGIYPLGNTPEGICDMAGNVAEWCSDWYAKDYYRQSPKKNPTGPDKGKYRVLRGGAWSLSAWYCRAAFRLGDHPVLRDDDVGFRVCLCRQNSPE
jgi:formylglycine-generating enzyme required for sulfatase activity